MAQVTAMSVTSLVLSFSHFLQLSTPPQFQGSLMAHSWLTHGWKSWSAHCLTFALDNRHHAYQNQLSAPLLMFTDLFTTQSTETEGLIFQDVGQLEVKLPHSEHPLNPTTKFDYCKVDKILNLTEGSCLESFTSFNRLSKSASSPDCPNLLILSPLTVGRVRGWQDILLKVFESKIGCFHLQLFSM